MERKEIEHSIPYFDQGEELTKKVKVSFVSNRVVRDYNILMERFSEIMKLQAAVQTITEEIGSIAVEKTLKYREKRTLVKEQIKKHDGIKAEIKAFDQASFLKDRFNLVKRIFDDNACTDDDLLSYEFWDDKTEPDALWSFLRASVMKDADIGKKKVI